MRVVFRKTVWIGENHDQMHKYHHLMTMLLLTLKMSTAQVVEMSVTNNSLSEDYSHPDNHTKLITDTIYQNYCNVLVIFSCKPFSDKLQKIK